jgi:hypothetical protein
MINVTQIENKFNAISLRERVLIFSALLICLFSISYFWIVEPAMVKQAKVQKNLQSQFKQENDLNNEIAELKIRLQKDPLQEINTKIAFSLQKLALLDQQLDEKLVKFIDAKKMPVALSKVLSQSPGVTVVSLSTLPVSAFNTIATNENITSTAVSTSPKNIFYKQTLEIKLTGTYDAIYQYFLNLEAIPEKFYWSVLTYQVTTYPVAEVTIRIYTVSEQKDLVSG